MSKIQCIHARGPQPIRPRTSLITSIGRFIESRLPNLLTIQFFRASYLLTSFRLSPYGVTISGAWIFYAVYQQPSISQAIYYQSGFWPSRSSCFSTPPPQNSRLAQRNYGEYSIYHYYINVKISYPL